MAHYTLPLLLGHLSDGIGKCSTGYRPIRFAVVKKLRACSDGFGREMRLKVDL
jgi:hypothetical protein